MTPSSKWTDASSGRAKQVWAEHLAQHDLSDRRGQTAGIDPVSGRIWFGKSIDEVIAQRDAEGIDAPLYFERVGSTTYYRKGGRK